MALAGFPAQAPVARQDADSGLVVELELSYTVQRKPPYHRTLVALNAVNWWTGAEVEAYSLGHPLLHR
ncbi:hypothetical protein O7626_35910 [Micromonospora sp. WMMD1102]|uniref:hypothetical protein n=1 Tax=Micromonospora sp. WMMD1102 TaxID=3016105 RepID=UPI0024152A3B|nr:hypothetical protein [Micromonospora sp. WMMD1102]MDG4791224.1 hypothetical protein [Micromonospora sp. WMMD1102]